MFAAAVRGHQQPRDQIVRPRHQASWTNAPARHAPRRPAAPLSQGCRQHCRMTWFYHCAAAWKSAQGHSRVKVWAVPVGQKLPGCLGVAVVPTTLTGVTWKPVGSLSALRGDTNGRFAAFCVSVDAHWYIAAAKRSGSELGGSLAVASCRLGCAVRSSAETAALQARRARVGPAADTVSGDSSRHRVVSNLASSRAWRAAQVPTKQYTPAALLW